MPKQQVAGFLLSEDHTRVIMIRKTHPDYMAGKLNAVGGGIEVGETARVAMVREFVEETGARIPRERWGMFAMLRTQHDTEVYFFVAVATHDEWTSVRSMTEEVVDEYPISEITTGEFETMPNNPWLLSMAVYCVVHQQIYANVMEVGPLAAKMLDTLDQGAQE